MPMRSVAEALTEGVYVLCLFILAGYASTGPARVQCVANNANTVTGATWATSATGSACVRVSTGRRLI